MTRQTFDYALPVAQHIYLFKLQASTQHTGRRFHTFFSAATPRGMTSTSPASLGLQFPLVELWPPPIKMFVVVIQGHTIYTILHNSSNTLSIYVV